MKTKGFPNVTKPEDEVKCEASDEFALTNYAKKEEKKGKGKWNKRIQNSRFIVSPGVMERNQSRKEAERRCTTGAVIRH